MPLVLTEPSLAHAPSNTPKPADDTRDMGLAVIAMQTQSFNTSSRTFVLAVSLFDRYFVLVCRFVSWVEVGSVTLPQTRFVRALGKVLSSQTSFGDQHRESWACLPS